MRTKNQTLIVLSLLFYAGLSMGETVTADLLLNLYDAPNNTYRLVGRTLTGRADIRGLFTGMNSATGLVPLRLGEHVAETVYTSELNVDRIDLEFNTMNNTILGSASRVEYTNSTSGGWVTLIDNIEASGAYTNGVAFSVDAVSGLRWVLPAESWTTNSASTFFKYPDEPYAPRFRRFYAYGVNTVPVDCKLNLVHAKAVNITTNAVWGAAFPTGVPSRINDQEGHLSAFTRSGSPPADAALQIELDRAYRFDRFLLHWGRNGDVRQTPNTYDLSVSLDGSTWVTAVEGHNATTGNPSEQVSDVSGQGVVGRFIKLHNLQGQHAWNTVSLTEVQAYGTILPPPATLVVIR